MHQPAAAGFTDVKDTDYFNTPVDWAKASGVTAGTSATTFSPAKTVSRAQMVTFLWAAAGSPEGFPAHGFSDVPAGALRGGLELGEPSYHCWYRTWGVLAE
ncbi:MAG: S-layer homology domain-containing protein [Candidatus Microthrix sp.]|uniref:S-layer homology domain-containing protein n=1 Tax=Candidatus Neomicrothrix sp. TaxID=2719034 RepID=UPI0025C18C5C|nr:S-layer homology domain-containing protein [Candidatus Microthrix sp.]MBL0203338.1 S-layer homology domain-containing protein [Candidatus Microthrix sp.]